MKKSLNVVVIGLAMVLGPMAAQAQTKVQRPVKNPPQYPNIIDLENKGATPRKTSNGETVAEAPQVQLPAALVKAVETLAIEVRTLVQEMRALNVRQQAQLDLLRLTRGDLRIDSYDRDLRSVVDRLTQLEHDEQALRAGLTPEGLQAQVARLGTLDKDETMRQIKRDLEGRLALVVQERDRLRLRKAELEGIVGGFRDANEKAEKRIELVEEALRQLTAPGRKPENPQ